MANDHRWSLWLQACDMLAEADQLQREFFRLGDSRRQPSWAPPADVLETADSLFLVVALPGVQAEDVELRLESGRLHVTGRRRWPPGLRRARIHRLELPHGHFERTVPVPPGRYELTGSRMTDGCLTVELRKLPGGPR